MKLLPKVLILLLLLTFYFAPLASAYAQEEDPQPEVVGTINEGDPAVGEEIPQTVTVYPGGAPSVDVGVQPNQFEFTGLTELTKTTEGALPFLLPKNLLQKLDLPEEEKLSGKIFHPVCRVDGAKPSGEVASKGTSNVQTPEWWPTTLAVTRLAQAVGVPGFDSWVKFENANPVFPNDEEQNKSMDHCLPVSLTSDSEVDQENSQLFTRIETGILGIIQRIIGLIIKPREVEVVTQSKKFVQGQTEFADQVARGEGFLRSFCFQDRCPKKDEVDAKVETPYVGKDTAEVAFQGVAGARTEYDDLVKSLYPESLKSVMIPNRGIVPPGGSDKLDYIIAYMDASYEISAEKKEKIIQDVLKNWPSSRIRELWDTVIRRSRAAGINPAFTIAIWIEEGGAGGANANSEFGCFPGGNTKLHWSFNDSLTCFINFTAREHPNNFTEWIRYFCGPRAEPICSNNPGFIRRLRSVWGQVSQ